MKHRDVAVILATGGMGLVRAAYSAGKPAYGVGPGNAPCFIERTADLAKAASDIIIGKCFDNGVLCSSPNSVVVDARGRRRGEARVRRSRARTSCRRPKPTSSRRCSSRRSGCRIRSSSASRRRSSPSRPASRCPPARACSSPSSRASAATIPLSIEKLCPVLSYYVVADWREGCERCIQILRYGGMGHTMSIHSRNEQVILEFGLKKPAFRIVVNTPTTHGSIGLTTGLDPAMTLGCGGYGGNITSDNISPRHLLNIKRLAYETAAGRRHARAARHGRRPRPPPRPGLAEGCRRRRRRPASTRRLVRDRWTTLLGTGRRRRPRRHDPASARGRRIRVRGRRAAGASKLGRKIVDRRAHDRHAGRARPGRGAARLRDRGLAASVTRGRSWRNSRALTVARSRCYPTGTRLAADERSTVDNG